MPTPSKLPVAVHRLAPHHGRPRRAAALGCLLIVIAASLSIGGASRAEGSTRTQSFVANAVVDAALPLTNAAGSALPTSVTTAHGTWVAIPMGLLDDPLNTFWQLFFRAAGSTRWKNEASTLAIATNGGILIAGGESGSLLVAVRPVNQLQFTTFVGFPSAASEPVVASPLDGVAEQVDAGPNGRRVALVGAGAHATLEEAASAGSSWARQLTVAALASSRAAHGCSPTSISAVGYGADGALFVGASCRTPGAVGLFRSTAGAWRRVGITGSEGADAVGVLEIQRASGRTAALLAASSGSRMRLQVATGTSTDTPWHRSPALTLAPGARLTSFGPIAGGGEFILGTTSVGTRFGYVLAGPDGPWSALPSPPVGTETLAAPHGGAITALAGVGSTMHSYALAGSPQRWTEAGHLSVDILYGSSS